MQITVINRGPESQTLHLLPTLWFRNTWSWDPKAQKPIVKVIKSGILSASHPTLGQRYLYCQGTKELLFAENETNYQRTFGEANTSP